MAKGFHKYYAATIDGVLHVETRQPIVHRGVIMLWDCFNLDYDPDDSSKGPRFIGVGSKHLFDSYEPAHKAVFKMKLTVSRENA